MLDGVCGTFKFPGKGGGGPGIDWVALGIIYVPD